MMSHAPGVPADLEIRRLTVDDLKIFRDIRAEALQTHPESFGSPRRRRGRRHDGGGVSPLAERSDPWRF